MMTRHVLRTVASSKEFTIRHCAQVLVEFKNPRRHQSSSECQVAKVGKASGMRKEEELTGTNSRNLLHPHIL